MGRPRREITYVAQNKQLTYIIFALKPNAIHSSSPSTEHSVPSRYFRIFRAIFIAATIIFFRFAIFRLIFVIFLRAINFVSVIIIECTYSDTIEGRLK